MFEKIKDKRTLLELCFIVASAIVCSSLTLALFDDETVARIQILAMP